MADRADGSIVINTKLDNSGFGKGSAEMKSAISSLQHQVDALGKRMDSTFANMQRAMSNSARSAQQYSKSVNSRSASSVYRNHLLRSMRPQPRLRRATRKPLKSITQRSGRRGRI